ncbi:HEAT repeat domain-containing protein, partial [Euryarchaeota archaeon]|nr:HEAT repeat domain-containing protein [Euryarchaeota archaeon]
MAKGSGVPEELLGLVAGLYMWHEDKTVRAAAKSVFTKYAPAELKRILRENWKAQYRTMSDWDYCCTIVDRLFKHFKKTQLHGIDIWSQAILRDSKGYTEGIFTGVIERFDTVTELKSALSKRGLSTTGSKVKLRERLKKAGFSTVPSLFFRAGPDFAFELAKTGDIRGIQSIIDSLGEASASDIESTAKVLKELGGPAIDMCNQTLQDGLVKTRAGVIGVLTIIGGEQAIIPIMDALANKSVRSSWANICLYIDIEDEGINAAENLGKIGGKEAVAPLLKMLNDSKASVRYMSAEALGETGDKRAVEPLIKLLKVSTKGSTDVREAAAKALGKIGDARMKAPLLKMLEGINANKLKNKRNDKDEEARMKGIEALLNCNIKKEQDVITVLTAYVQFYGLSNSHGYEFNVLHSKFTSWFAELEPKYLEKLFIAANSMGKSTNYGKYGVITKKEENDYYDIWGCADENFSEIIQEFGEKAIDPLIDILGNKDYHYHLHKKAAVELGKLGAYGAGEVLTKAFEAYSEDYPASDVHKAAAKALKKIKYTGKTVMLNKFLDCTDSKKAKAILEKLEDWMLAGLVVWGEVNKTQKNWITKKLLTDPKEAFLKYWVDIKIPEDSILIKTGHFEDFSSPKIQASKKPTGCRGRHQWPNKQMKRGDVRLSIRLPNPDNPYYIGKDWDPYTGRPTSGSYQKENLVTYYF